MRYEISGWQLTLLLVAVNLSLLVSYAPVVTGQLPPVRDVWLSTIIAAGPAALLTYLGYWIVRRTQGQNLFQAIRTVLGPIVGTGINIGLVGFFINWATIVTREFSLFMGSVVYLRTPDVIFVIIFVILGLVGASQQIEFIGRTAELAGILVMIGVIFLIVANIPKMDVDQLRPVMVESWPLLLRQAITPAIIFAEAVWIVLIAAPYLNKLSDAPRAIGVGLALNTIFGVLSALVLMMIFGPELISIIAFVPLSAARLIQLGDIMERLEWILLLLWFGSMGVKVSFLMWSARLGLSSLVPGWSRDINLFVVTGAVFGWSLIAFPTLTDIVQFFDPARIMPQLGWPLLFPVLLGAVVLLRGINSKAPDEESVKR